MPDAGSISPHAWEIFGGLVAILVFLATASMILRKAGIIGGTPPARVKEMIADALEGLPTAAKVQGLETRVAMMEGRLSSLPTAVEFAGLRTTLAAVEGDVKAVAASVDGMDKMIAGLNRQFGDLNRHLLRVDQ